MRKFLFFFITIILINNKVLSLDLTITQGSIKPTPIAISNFFSSTESTFRIGKNISMVISDNLERSGLFEPIDQKAFIQSPESLAQSPRFEDWKVIKSQHLVSGKINKRGDKISVEFRLYDVFAQKELIGKKYETTEKNWRRVSHIISDAIFSRLTGDSGYFDTRIVYVAETGPKDNKQKRLAIMDQDQANHRFLTDGSYLVLTPRFSPNSQKITYMSYIKNNLHEEIEENTTLSDSEIKEENTLGSLVINSEDLSKSENTSQNQKVDSSDEEENLPSLSPEDQFQQAFDLLRNQRFDEAKTSFLIFIEENNENILSGTAHYWLGEIYLLKKEYREAALILAEGYQKFPASIKAPDMLYKLSESLFLIDKKTDSCSTLIKLNKEYPDNKLKSKIATKVSELNCSIPSE